MRNMEVKDRIGNLKEFKSDSGVEFWRMSEDKETAYQITRSLPIQFAWQCQKCRPFCEQTKTVYALMKRTENGYEVIREHCSLGCAAVELNVLFRNYQVSRLNQLLNKSGR